jgi:hypothetical protein
MSLWIRWQTFSRLTNGEFNAEHLTVASYNRLLRVVAGKEPPSKGQELTTKYQFLLPYFVLGGMAGLRTCELVRSEPTDPVLNWEDICETVLRPNP